MPNWTTELHGAVALLTFTRPPRNLMNFAAAIELGDTLERFAAKTEQVKIVMLTGGVDGVFIDHAELSDLARAGAGRATDQELGSWARAERLLEEIPQPTIAAIDGLAAGGGNEIALACTLRIGSLRAQLQQPEVSAGIIPGGGGSVRLGRLVGPGIAAEAIITGRAFKAQEALQAGWINAVLPADNFIRHALAWAAAITQNPGPALNAAKKTTVFGARLLFADALELEQQLFTQLTAKSHLLNVE
jgi:enoyl-CoA hydratase